MGDWGGVAGALAPAFATDRAKREKEESVPLKVCTCGATGGRSGKMVGAEVVPAAKGASGAFCCGACAMGHSGAIREIPEHLGIAGSMPVIPRPDAINFDRS